MLPSHFFIKENILYHRNHSWFWLKSVLIAMLNKSVLSWMYVVFIMQLFRNDLSNPFYIKENLVPFIFLPLTFWTQRIQLFSGIRIPFHTIKYECCWIFLPWRTKTILAINVNGRCHLLWYTCISFLVDGQFSLAEGQYKA